MKVLLAIDDSKFSEAATQALIAQAKPTGTEVRVLHVIESFVSLKDWKPVIEQLRKKGKVLLAQTAQALRTAGFQVATTMEEGNPKSVIVDFAAQWPADLVVMGSHGDKGFDRFLLGSVSESVVRHAPCSVQVVRIPKR
ncbi:MAG: universal stress protein [Acidobacteriia bacterium]|nr:universal stress protein [Terriglobia bacterium]